MPENPSTVAEIIRQAEAGTCAPAIEAVKRYMHNEGAKLRLCRAYHEEQPGPSPTPSELYRLADVLRDWGNARGVDMGPLQEFIRQEQRRLSSLISASGFVLSQPFSKADWNNAALRADETLNTLRRRGRMDNGREQAEGQQYTSFPTVHPDDWRALRMLASSHEAVLISDLAAELNRDRSGVGKQVRRLEEVGLVRRPFGERGGIAITDLGRKVLAEAEHPPR